MQAARKLSKDFAELKTLRMERDETLRLKKDKQAREDNTMKRIFEMENDLQKASGDVDQANLAVRRLETENAEVRAEMEASKLSAAESVATCQEIAKREKKCLKRVQDFEKQESRLQDEICEEKQKIAQLQQELSLIRDLQKEMEVRAHLNVSNLKLFVDHSNILNMFSSFGLTHPEHGVRMLKTLFRVSSISPNSVKEFENFAVKLIVHYITLNCLVFSSC